MKNFQWGNYIVRTLYQGQSIGGPCGTIGKGDNRIKYFCLENYFASQLEDLRVRKTIILKMVFMYWMGIYEVNLSGWE